MRKRLLLILCSLLYSCSYCCGRDDNGKHKYNNTCVGIDLASGICLNTIRIMTSHRLNHNWNIGFDVGITLKKSSYNKTDEEHKNLLNMKNKSETEDKELRHCTQEFNMYTGFWPIKTLHGPFITLGYKIKDGWRPDMSIGIGYSFKIFNHIHGTVAYQPGILEAIHRTQLTADGLRTYFCYTF